MMEEDVLGKAPLPLCCLLSMVCKSGRIESLPGRTSLRAGIPSTPRRTRDLPMPSHRWVAV